MASWDAMFKLATTYGPAAYNAAKLLIVRAFNSYAGKASLTIGTSVAVTYAMTDGDSEQISTSRGMTVRSHVDPLVASTIAPGLEMSSLVVYYGSPPIHHLKPCQLITEAGTTDVMVYGYATVRADQKVWDFMVKAVNVTPGTRFGELLGSTSCHSGVDGACPIGDPESWWDDLVGSPTNAQAVLQSIIGSFITSSGLTVVDPNSNGFLASKISRAYRAMMASHVLNVHDISGAGDLAAVQDIYIINVVEFLNRLAKTLRYYTDLDHAMQAEARYDDAYISMNELLFIKSVANVLSSSGRVL